MKMQDEEATFAGGVSFQVFFLFAALWWALSILLRQPKWYEMKRPDDN